VEEQVQQVQQEQLLVQEIKELVGQLGQQEKL
jgi:hypothetical protein